MFEGYSSPARQRPSDPGSAQQDQCLKREIIVPRRDPVQTKMESMSTDEQKAGFIVEPRSLVEHFAKPPVYPIYLLVY